MVAWLLVSGRDSEFVGVLVAALLAEQESAQSADELLRFVQRDNAKTGEPRDRNPWQSSDVG